MVFIVAITKIKLKDMLVSRGIAKDMHQAIGMIMSGSVYSDNRILDKPGFLLKQDQEIYVKNQNQYVSRGAYKLKAAIDYFNIDIAGLTCIDLGASTGGFTQVLLEYGAKRVISVDVGYGEFAYKLRIDPRVVLLERTNVKNIPEEVIVGVDLIVCDLSFIGIISATKRIFTLMSTTRHKVILLIKPQFEARKYEVEDGGLVTNEEIHNSICNKVKDHVVSIGYEVFGVIRSPILGTHGNREFLLFCEKKFSKQ